MVSGIPWSWALESEYRIYYVYVGLGAPTDPKNSEATLTLTPKRKPKISNIPESSLTWSLFGAGRCTL